MLKSGILTVFLLSLGFISTGNSLAQTSDEILSNELDAARTVYSDAQMTANIQTNLNTLGYQAGQADGVLGENTFTAIISFLDGRGLLDLRMKPEELQGVLGRLTGNVASSEPSQDSEPPQNSEQPPAQVVITVVSESAETGIAQPPAAVVDSAAPESPPEGNPVANVIVDASQQEHAGAEQGGVTAPLVPPQSMEKVPVAPSVTPDAAVVEPRTVVPVAPPVVAAEAPVQLKVETQPTQVIPTPPPQVPVTQSTEQGFWNWLFGLPWGEIAGVLAVIGALVSFIMGGIKFKHGISKEMDEKIANALATQGKDREKFLSEIDRMEELIRDKKSESDGFSERIRTELEEKIRKNKNNVQEEIDRNEKTVKKMDQFNDRFDMVEERFRLLLDKDAIEEKLGQIEDALKRTEDKLHELVLKAEQDIRASIAEFLSKKYTSEIVEKITGSPK